MPSGISVEFAPNPLSYILTVKMPTKMSKCQTPRLSHDFLLSCISLVGEMDVVEYALLHLVESNETDLLEAHRFHQMVKLVHEDFVYCSQVTRCTEIAVKRRKNP